MSSYHPQWSNLNERQQAAVNLAYNEGVLRQDSYNQVRYGLPSHTEETKYNYDRGPDTSISSGWPPIVYSWGFPNQN